MASNPRTHQGDRSLESEIADSEGGHHGQVNQVLNSHEPNPHARQDQEPLEVGQYENEWSVKDLPL